MPKSPSSPLFGEAPGLRVTTSIDNLLKKGDFHSPSPDSSPLHLKPRKSTKSPPARLNLLTRRDKEIYARGIKSRRKLRRKRKKRKSHKKKLI